MLRYLNYDIVFQEIPNEVTLAVNITNCPNGCKGCHSPQLQGDVGETLEESVVAGLLEKYGEAITCLCFMGGDAAPHEVERLAGFVRTATGNRIKTAWYSGRQNLSENCTVSVFDYIKLGPYIAHLGGLTSPTTNQRFYCIENGELQDKTVWFCKE